MPKNFRKNYFYEAGTWLKYEILRQPRRHAIIYDNKSKNPDLTLVFLHGIAASSNTWRHVIPATRKECPDVRLITLDLVGYGKAPRAEWFSYSYKMYAKALRSTLKHAKINSPIVLVGHSMGCLLSNDFIQSKYSKDFDIRNLILVSAPILMPGEVAKMQDKFYVNSFHQLAENSSGNAFVSSAADVISFLSISNFQSKYLPTKAFYNGIEKIILNRENFDKALKLKLPTLMMHGYVDPLVIGENMKKLAERNKKYIRYESALGGHEVSNSKQAKIIREVKRILKEVKQEKEDAGK